MNVSNSLRKIIFLSVVSLSLSGCDLDGDYIPNNVEHLIGSNPANPDENENGILDGLDTEGHRGDPSFDRLWHAKNLGTAGAMDVYHDYMGYNGGNNIIVQVVDSGVDAYHEDLVDNMDMTRSYNEFGVIGNPSSRNNFRGTMAAKIIAARAFNGIGGRGIAPFVKIAGSNWLIGNTSTESLKKVWLTGHGANEIAVSNNNWVLLSSKDTRYENIMEQGVNTLRDGKGRVYVFAAGDARMYQRNSNYAYLNSNRYGITVAAVKDNNTHTGQSIPGSNIWVSGYGSSTGAAAPVVTAAIALTLEACPDLTWRDVKYLVAKNAIPIDTSNSSWVTNAAGYKHSADYGFGLVNTKGMIDECKYHNNLPVEKTREASATFNSLIPDNGSKNTFTVNIPDNIKIEWVEVTIDNDNKDSGNYRVHLVSPSGTKIQLLEPNEIVIWANNRAWFDGGFRLATAAMLNEDSRGNWKIIISDELSGDSGTLKTIKLKVYGH